MTQKITNITEKKRVAFVTVIIVRYDLRSMMRIERDGRQVANQSQFYEQALHPAQKEAVPVMGNRPAQSQEKAQEVAQAKPAQEKTPAKQVQENAQEVAQAKPSQEKAQEVAQAKPAQMKKAEKDVLPVLAAARGLDAQRKADAARRPQRLAERPVAVNQVRRSIPTNASSRSLQTNPMPVRTPGRNPAPVRMTLRTAPAQNPLDKGRKATVVKMNRAMDARRRMLLALANQYRQRAA